MEDLNFKQFSKEQDSKDMISFLVSQNWPYHSNKKETEETVEEKVNLNHFNSKEIQTFWILSEHKKIGFVRIFDIENDDESSPLFDIRIKEEFQGKGYGTKSVFWTVNHVFSTYEQIKRIEATTREDNISMQKVLEKVGFKQEARYRKAWKIEENNYVDSLGFALLKEEFLNKD